MNFIDNLSFDRLPQREASAHTNLRLAQWKVNLTKALVK